jgi:DNA-binding NtrC family response regulator
MATSIPLEPQVREFCELVSQAAFSNPFSQERVAADLRIAGHPKAVAPPERLKLLQHAISNRVRELEATGKADLQLYGREDHYLMQTTLLFDVYLQFYDRFDQLILDQIKLGDTPCPVEFADEALGVLYRRNFPAVDAARYFAILYQIRRAHYFIARGLIGQSPCMQEFRRHLWNNVFTHDIRWYDRYLWNRMEDFSTLLLGETGTGKGTAAAAIGRSGFIPFDEKKRCFAESFTHSFISLNLSQYSEALIESELFGHKKGAFTGAIEAHQGIFARCSPHGAIFLDEIGDVGAAVQIKLLQVLQDRTFSPVGSHEKLRFHGRVIAATNKPIETLRRENLFRDDFFYRLCSDSIVVPSLRQRLQEDPHELDQLLDLLVTRTTGEKSCELVQMVQTVINQSVGRSYGWPGNVRELEQAVRRILLTRHYEGDGQAIAPGLRKQLVDGIEAGNLEADEVLSIYCRLLFQRHENYEEVARRTNLDRRTVKKYLQQPAREDKGE